MLLLRLWTTPDDLSLDEVDAGTFDLEHVNRSAAAGKMQIAQCPTTFRYVVYERRFILLFQQLRQLLCCITTMVYDKKNFVLPSKNRVHSLWWTPPHTSSSHGTVDFSMAARAARQEPTTLRPYSGTQTRKHHAAT